MRKLSCRLPVRGKRECIMGHAHCLRPDAQVSVRRNKSVRSDLLIVQPRSRPHQNRTESPRRKPAQVLQGSSARFQARTSVLRSRSVITTPGIRQTFGRCPAFERGSCRRADQMRAVSALVIKFGNDHSHQPALFGRHSGAGCSTSTNSMFLFSSLERLMDRQSSRRYVDASIQSLLAGIWSAR